MNKAKHTFQITLVLGAFFLSSLVVETYQNKAYASNNGQTPYVWILDAESLFGYSDTAGPTEGDFSTYNQWLTSLAYNLDSGDQIIGAYNGNFQQSRLFISQEEGRRESNQMMTHNASVAFKKQVNENFHIKPAFFYNLVYVKETNDEDLGDGLYDYEDIGGSIQNVHTVEANSQNPKVIYYGGSIFKREYPNFQSLISIFDPNNSLEEDEKDFIGYKVDAGIRTKLADDLTASLDSTFLFKDFTDKLTIDTNGIRESNDRQDIYYEIVGNLNKIFNELFSVQFNSAFRHNISNLDFYDTRNTPGLGDDRFFDDYYDYLRYHVSPAVNINIAEILNTNKKASVQVGYKFDKTYYPGRTALDVVGNLKSDDQEDLNHQIFTRVNVAINDEWDWIASAKYEKQTSNQKFEQFYEYNYESWQVLTGVSFKN